MSRCKRVVITGLGPVTPSGIGKGDFWKNTIAGKSSLKLIDRFDTSKYDSKIAGMIDGFDVSEFMPVFRSRQCDRFTHLAIAGVVLALRDAQLDLDKENKNKIGCMVGNNLGGVEFGENELYNLYTKGERAVSPYQAIAWFYTATQGQISLLFDIFGYSKTFSADRLSSNHAIGEAYRAIQRGRMDVALAGGTEAPLRPYGFVGYLKTGILSQRNDVPSQAYRPFDLSRDGLVIGEGGAILVLEELERALKRGAHIYAEIVGYASTCDGYHHNKAAPDCRQFARAIRLALEESGVNPSEVGYINAAGEGTLTGDRRETAAIKEVFGKAAYSIPVSAPKSMFGNLYGGAGAADLVCNALVHETGTIPPTINYQHQDSCCDLWCVPNQAERRDVEVALVNAMGHGGIYAVLATRKFSNSPNKVERGSR